MKQSAIALALFLTVLSPIFAATTIVSDGDVPAIMNSGGAGNIYQYIIGLNSPFLRDFGTGSVRVGDTGRFNQLYVEAGSELKDNFGTVGNGNSGNASMGSQNLARIYGTGAQWTTTRGLNVGNYGSDNSLLVLAGGRVTADEATIGSGSSLNSNLGNRNSVVVSGANSTWQTTRRLTVGSVGSDNSFAVGTGSGGSAVTHGVALGAFAPAARNTFSVSFAGATWTDDGVTYIGIGGSANALRIEAGGVATTLGCTIGFGDGATFNSALGSMNSALVTGSGSVWNSGGVVVGNYGSSNTLRVEDQALMHARFLAIGSGSPFSAAVGNDNSVTLSGQGSSLDITDAVPSFANLTIGSFGSRNSLRIEAGATATVQSRVTIGDTRTSDYLDSGDPDNPYPRIDRGVGRNNSVIVTGAGSTLTIGESLVIGAGSATGSTLTIEDGALVKLTLDTATLSFAGGTTNALRIDQGYLAWAGDHTSDLTSLIASGRILHRNGNGWDESFWGGEYFLGYHDTADAAGNATNGAYTFDGAYTILTSAPSYGGLKGDILLENTNVVISGPPISGPMPTPSPNGHTSPWEIDGDLSVGVGTGTTTLTIQAGGGVSNHAAFVAENTGGTSTVTVKGTGSRWKTTGDLNAGTGGQATINIESGGLVSVGGNVTLGSGTNVINIGAYDLDHSTAGGTLQATALNLGAQAVLNFNQNDSVTFDVPIVYGQGSVVLRGSGATTFTAPNDATTLIHQGFAIFDGAASTTGSNYLGVGTDPGDNASLKIQSGALVTNSDAGIGEVAGSTGSATVTGNGSVWTLGTEFRVGEYGTGTLSIEDGGTVVTSSAPSYIGRWAGATGEVDVGSHAKWTAGFIGLGALGNGRLFVFPGGTVTSTAVSLAGADGSDATITVTGPGANWTHTGDVALGQNGHATLNVWNGGTATITGALTSGAANSEINVSGNGTSLSGITTLDIGSFNPGNGTMTIDAGAHVNSETGRIGQSFTAGSNGLVTVTGTGSTWTNTGNLTVGYSGKGSLEITAGGVVTASAFRLANADGTLRVNGTSSTITVTDAFTLERGNTVVSAGGTITAPLGVDLGTDTGSATLDIGSPDLLHPTTAGTIDSPEIRFTNGTLSFNQSDDISFSPQLVTTPGGTSNLVQQGTGVTTLTASNNEITGVTTVLQGTLAYGVRTALGALDQPGFTADKLVVHANATASFRVGGTDGFLTSDLDILSHLGTADGGFLSGATLGIETSDAFIYGSALADPNGGLNVLQLAKLGTSSLTLTGDSSFSGGTTIFGGTLVAASNTALGTGKVVIKGGTLQIQGGVTLTNTLVLAGGQLATQLGDGTELATLGNFKNDVSGGNVTIASILGGTTSSSANLQTGFAAVSSATNDDTRLSGIFTLSGVPIVDLATGATDTFVLQLKIANVTPDSFLAWYNPAVMSWVNAVEGNHGGVEFFKGIGAYDPTTDFDLGKWGVDVAGGSVWAVLNHNSDFAITVSAIPEPRDTALAIIALLALVVIARRRTGATFG